MTSTLYSEQIEVLFCLLVNILHTISDIYMTAKKKKKKKPEATTTAKIIILFIVGSFSKAWPSGAV